MQKGKELIDSKSREVKSVAIRRGKSPESSYSKKHHVQREDAPTARNPSFLIAHPIQGRERQNVVGTETT